ncbi:unnamed protein product, partial [Pylaiella littoralis]
CRRSKGTLSTSFSSTRIRGSCWTRSSRRDLIQGNLAKGDGRGYRFHPSTLKFCIYY